MAGTNTSDLDPLFLKALTLLHSKNPNSTEELKALVQGYREKVFGSSVPQASKVCLCYFRIIIYDWQFGSQYPETIGNIHLSQSLFVNVFFVSSGTWPRNLPMLAGYNFLELARFAVQCNLGNRSEISIRKGVWHRRQTPIESFELCNRG